MQDQAAGPRRRRKRRRKKTPEAPPAEVKTLYGYIESIDDDMATVLVGEDFEEWTFPVSVLPEDAHADSYLLLESVGGKLSVISLAASVPSLDTRLDRRLNRKRPIVVPLPHRERRAPEVREMAIDQRVSRYARGLGN